MYTSTGFCLTPMMPSLVRSMLLFSQSRERDAQTRTIA